MDERLIKWRMILGKGSDQQGEVNLSAAFQQMDNCLDALYDSERSGGLGNSSPNVNRWLGDIRKYFPKSVVQMMQKDAIERLHLDKLLLEPEVLESVEPDVNLVGTLISLNKALPSKTKETARKVIKKVVSDLEKRLKAPMRQAVQGALSRSVKNRRPKYNEIDWGKTIQLNMKSYQPKYKTIIPERLVGHGRKGRSLKNIILLIDQSGSMATSVVYASVFGAVLASLPAVKTNLVFFDTNVVDLTPELKDPIEVLFGAQLGGGTDINKALRYAQDLVKNPSETILVLISDLYEGGNESEMIKRAANIKASGVNFVTLLALNDEGTPYYDKKIAQTFANLNIPAFACSPDQFPGMMATAIAKGDMGQWMGKVGVTRKN